MSDQPRRQRDLLVAVFALTCAFTWGIAALILLFPQLIEAFFGPMSAANPLFILAVAGPTLVATILTFAKGGWSGLGALYARLFRWRFGLQWYALLFVGIPLTGYLISRVTGSHARYDLRSPALVLGLLLNELILGPFGEELGWRGFALPRLLRRFSPLVASLILGAIWGVWHVPSFFVSGLPQANDALPVFLGGALCLAVLATWIYLHTGGSVLSVALFHYMVNLALDMFGMPMPALTAVAAVTAVLVILLDRKLGWFKRAQARSLQEDRVSAPTPGTTERREWPALDTTVVGASMGAAASSEPGQSL